MNELPTGWANALLQDLGRWSSGGTPSRSNPAFYGPGIPWVKTGDLRDRYVADVPESITEAGLANSAAKIFPAGTLLIAMYGATIGRTGVLLGPAATNQAAAALVADGATREVIPYVWWYLRSQLSALREAGQGGAQPNISQEILKGIPIAVPPLAEQRRIVAKLDALTARTARARAELNRVPILAEQQRRAVLASTFASLPGAAAEVRIEQVARQIFDGPFGSHLKSTDYTDAGARVIRLENIGHLAFNADKRTFVSMEKYASLARHTLQAEDVLFSSFVDEQVRVCLAPNSIEPAINKADCFCIRVDASRCDPRFLAYRLACHSTYEAFRSQVHGATRPRVNLGQLKAFSFYLPALSVQAEVVRHIDQCFAEIDRLVAEAAAARRLLDRLDQAILAKAFRGELVPQDPDDAPASVLLDRIRAERAAAPAQGRRGRKSGA